MVLYYEWEGWYMNAERRKIIMKIVAQFESQEFYNVCVNESIGGNAGSNKAAINSFVDKETGEVIMFGNIQNIPDHIRYNSSFTGVTFLYDLGTSFRTFIETITNQVLSMPQVSERILMPWGGEEFSISVTAEANLRLAIRIVNYHLALRFQEQIHQLRKEHS